MKQIMLAAVAVVLIASPVHAQSAAPANPPEGFVTQQQSDRLASRLIGLNIRNPANETVGEIYDIVLTDANAIRAYIVSVGGFLGIGTRYVAIDPKAIAINRQDEKNWTATMNVNKDQLRAAPEYKWQSEWRKR
jgi:PRC-barrel domain